jgi:hypothetical protein
MGVMSGGYTASHAASPVFIFTTLSISSHGFQLIRCNVALNCRTVTVISELSQTVLTFGLTPMFSYIMFRNEVPTSQ